MRKMRFIHRDCDFDLNSWGGPIYGFDHEGIIGIYVVGSHGFCYGLVVCCSSIKNFLCNNFTILSQVRTN